MERQLGCEDFADHAVTHDAAYGTHRIGEPIGEVGGQEPVRRPRGPNHSGDLYGVAAQRGLAEHGEAAAERRHRQARMQRVRHRDDDAIDVGLEQINRCRNQSGIGHEREPARECLSRDVPEQGRDGNVAARKLRQTAAAAGAHTEEAQPW